MFDDLALLARRALRAVRSFLETRAGLVMAVLAAVALVLVRG